MKKLLILSLSLLFTAGLFSQELRYHQIKPLPAGHVIYRVGSVNSSVELNAALIPVTTVTGLTATDVQGAIAELQGEIISGGDGWGTDVIASGTALSGDGTSGSPLNIVPGNIATSTLNNDAGFLTTETDDQNLVVTGTVVTIEGGTGTFDLAAAGTDDQNLVLTGDVLSIQGGTGTVDLSTYRDDADASTTNEIQTISKAGSTVTLSLGGGTFTDAVDDADADATNELNVFTRAADQNDVVGTNTGGTFSVIGDYHSDEVAVSGGATTVTLPATPDLTVSDIHFTRNGVIYKASTTDGAEYFFVNGAVIRPSTGEAALEDGETIGYHFPK